MREIRLGDPGRHRSHLAAADGSAVHLQHRNDLRAGAAHEHLAGGPDVEQRERPFAGRDAEIQKLGKQVRDLQATLEKDGVTMAENDRRAKERDLANMSRDLQRMQREFREDLNLRRNEELTAVQERANKVIQQIAIDEKFDLIIQDPVIYASPRIDVTERVIKALADK